MAGISKNFFRATPGQLVGLGRRRFRITHLITVESVLAEDLETRQSERLRVESLVDLGGEVPQANLPQLNGDTALFSGEDWAEGQRRFEAIKPLLEDPIRSRTAVEAVAAKAGTHAETLYKWLKLYQSAQHVAALIPQRRGLKVGISRLSGEQEAIIDSAIEDAYLHEQRGRPESVVLEVQRRCLLAKVKAPSPNAVRLKINRLGPTTALRARGQKDVARNGCDLIEGERSGAEASPAGDTTFAMERPAAQSADCLVTADLFDMDIQPYDDISAER